MTVTPPPLPRAGVDPEIGYHPGRLGRLGVWVTRNGWKAASVRILLVVGLGAFAPRVESDLSGAGWRAVLADPDPAQHPVRA